MEPRPQQPKWQILTTRLPGNSLILYVNQKQDTPSFFQGRNEQKKSSNIFPPYPLIASCLHQLRINSVEKMLKEETRTGQPTQRTTEIAMMSPVQFSSVAQSCPTLCDPTDCSSPGLPVHHQLPEFTQTENYLKRSGKLWHFFFLTLPPTQHPRGPSPPAWSHPWSPIRVCLCFWAGGLQQVN